MLFKTIAGRKKTRSGQKTGLTAHYDIRTAPVRCSLQPTSPAKRGREQNLLRQRQSHGTLHLPPDRFPFRALRLQILAARINTQPSFRRNGTAPGDANRTGARQTSDCLSYALNGLTRLWTAWLQMSGYDVDARVPAHFTIIMQ